MEHKQNKIIHLFDERQSKPIAYKFQDTGNIKTFQLKSLAKFGEINIEYFTPNITAIFLSANQKSRVAAKKIFDEVNKLNLSTDQAFRFNEEGTILLYHYFEAIQVSIITLYTAVESLVNALIPDTIKWYGEKNKKKGNDYYDKEDIERRLTTPDKLTKVLPECRGISSPEHYVCWQNFLNLKAVRDEIIHLKSSSIQGGNGNKNLLNKLLDKTIFDYITGGRQLIVELSEVLGKDVNFPILPHEDCGDSWVLDGGDEADLKPVDVYVNE